MLPMWSSGCSICNESCNATSVPLSPVGLGLLRGGDGDDQPDHRHRYDDLARRRHHHQRHTHHHPHSYHPIHSFQSPFDDFRKLFHHARDNMLMLLQYDNDNDGNAPTSSISTTATRFFAGTMAFYTTAFSLQYVQYKLLKISTGTKPGIIPVGCGIITVALGSWMGHLAGLGVAASASSSVPATFAATTTSPLFMQARRSNFGHIGFEEGIDSISNAIRQLPEIAGSGYRCAREMMRPMMCTLSDMNNNNNRLSGKERKERKEVWMHAARICILGLLTYKTIFRSHFASLSPSSYTARGSFARIGLPAPPNFNYATSSQRAQLERIGRWWGCHTCGSRRIFSNSGKSSLFRGGGIGGSATTLPKFHGDHIPPVSVAKQINNQWHRRVLGWKVKQRFYPQCRTCSNKQGGLLSRAVNAGHRNLHAVGGGEESFFHGRRLRIGHLTGGVVAVLSIGSITADNYKMGEAALVESSMRRMLSMQKWFENVSREMQERIVRTWSDR